MSIVYSAYMIIVGCIVSLNSVSYSIEWCLGTIMICMAMFMNVVSQK